MDHNGMPARLTRVIMKGIKKCCMSSAVDETCDMLWNGSKNEWMKLLVKYFFLADILFLGVVLHLDKYIFPWQTCFVWGGGGGVLN
jgi:hypothetical protein